MRRVPPPKGDPDGAAAGADHRLLVRQLRRRRLAGARRERLAAARARRSASGPRAAPTRSTSSAASRRSRWWPMRSTPARSASSSPASRKSTARRSATPSRSTTRPCSEPLPGFKAIKPRVFAGLFPVSSRRLRGLPRRAAEAEAQRLGAALRARGLDRARLRLPLRLPRPAAHGHRAGAARARVRAVARHQRADRGLRGADDRRRDRQRRQPGQAAAGRHEIKELREPIIVANILLPPDYVGPVMKLCIEKRGVQKKLLYLGNQVSMQ